MKIGYISMFMMVCFQFIISCKKESEEPPLPPVNTCDQITEVLMYHPYDDPPMQREATITYDERGRVKTVTGAGQNTATYEYYRDSIVLKAFDIFGSEISQIYYLNIAGYISGTISFDYEFTYDAEGHLISFKQPYGDASGILGSTPYTLTYNNGDVVEITTTSPNVSTNKVSFTYYDEPNQDLMGYNQTLYIGSVLYDRNTFYLIKMGFFGKQSAHLLKTMDRHDGYVPRPIEYVKDSKGRITETVGGFGFKYSCP